MKLGEIDIKSRFGFSIILLRVYDFFSFVYNRDIFKCVAQNCERFVYERVVYDSVYYTHFLFTKKKKTTFAGKI